MSVPMTEVRFPSQGVSLGAGFYPAAGAELAGDRGHPCVVMGHGLGGTREAGLEPFAQAFAAAGLHVLCFDYRGFGSSDGQPRQVVNVRMQLQDWAAAIAQARAMPGVDPERIALWGSSFSGAHSVAAAVQDGRVAAVSSQGAMMDGLAATLNLLRQSGLVPTLKLTAMGLADAVLGGLGLGRVTAPVVGLPGEPGVLTTPDAKPGYLRLTPPHWRNEISTSWALSLALYRPNRMTPRLPCPALFCIATADAIVPPSAMEDGARRAPGKVEVRRYPVGHFDIYVPPVFEQVCGDQLAFFRRVLRP